MWSSSESVQKMHCCALCVLSISCHCTVHLDCVNSVLHTYSVSLVVSPHSLWNDLSGTQFCGLLAYNMWMVYCWFWGKRRKERLKSLLCLVPFSLAVGVHLPPLAPNPAFHFCSCGSHLGCTRPLPIGLKHPTPFPNRSFVTCSQAGIQRLLVDLFS